MTYEKQKCGFQNTEDEEQQTYVKTQKRRHPGMHESSSIVSVDYNAQIEKIIGATPKKPKVGESAGGKFICIETPTHGKVSVPVANFVVVSNDSGESPINNTVCSQILNNDEGPIQDFDQFIKVYANENADPNSMDLSHNSTVTSGQSSDDNGENDVPIKVIVSGNTVEEYDESPSDNTKYSESLNGVQNELGVKDNESLQINSELLNENETSSGDEFKLLAAQLNAKMDRILLLLEKSKYNWQSMDDSKESLDEMEVNFPILSIEDLTKFETILTIVEQRKRLTAYFKQQVGGSGYPGKKVAYILTDKLFSRPLLTHFTWTGSSKNNNKKSFSVLKEINKFFYNIVKSIDKNYNDLEHENFFKNGILKYSVNRATPNTNNRKSTPRTHVRKSKFISDDVVRKQSVNSDEPPQQ